MKRRGPNGTLGWHVVREDGEDRHAAVITVEGVIVDVRVREIDPVYMNDKPYCAMTAIQTGDFKQQLEEITAYGRTVVEAGRNAIDHEIERLERLIVALKAFKEREPG